MWTRPRPIRPAIMLALLLPAFMAALGPSMAAARTQAPPASGPAALCEAASRRAAAETGVPPDILAALALTETGRRQDGTVRPWAWSVNSEGQGTWFDDPGQALAYAQDRLAQGRRNLDIGCFQINYHWHGDAFASVAQMFDPLLNARYAARFLRDLHAETGDWRQAAGAFHSRNSKHASAYLARFDQLHAMLRERRGGGGAAETYNRFAGLTGQTRSHDAGIGVEVPVPGPDPRGPIDLALASGRVAGMAGNPDGWAWDMPDMDMGVEMGMGSFPDDEQAVMRGDAFARQARRPARQCIAQTPRTLLGALPGDASAPMAASLALLGDPGMPLIGTGYASHAGEGRGDDPLTRAILLAAAGSLAPAEAPGGNRMPGSLWQ